MKAIAKDVLIDAAHRLLFDMSEEEYATLEEECKILIKQMETIGKIGGLEDYSPMTFPFPCETSYLREDEALPPLSKEDALSNAGSTLDGQIKLPKVVL